MFLVRFLTRYFFIRQLSVLRLRLHLISTTSHLMSSSDVQVADQTSADLFLLSWARSSEERRITELSLLSPQAARALQEVSLHTTSATPEWYVLLPRCTHSEVTSFLLRTMQADLDITA